MVNHNLDELISSAENILLLQGPIGPFFYDFSTWLKKEHRKQVFKLNFNGGDDHFYPNHTENTFPYREAVSHFSDYLLTFCRHHHIQAIVCFGDCRSYHQTAKRVAKQLNLSFWAFEEGYFRPEYITLEKDGVNAYSLLPRRADFFNELADDLPEVAIPQRVAKGFLPMAKQAICYYWQANRKQCDYPEYCHHKHLNVCHYLKLWTISGLKRSYYYLHDCYFAHQVMKGKFGKFFILPLQVYNDSQVQVHSDYPSVADYLEEILHSFAHHAPTEVNLIVKHHPMDRGFTDYSKIIEKMMTRFPSLRGRVFYIHDVPMPVLLRNGIGLVTLNSTSGLSALHHDMPVKVIGRANYDFDGLTDQQPLSTFWSNPQPPNPEVFNAYYRYHMSKTHINGNFYTRVILRSPYNNSVQQANKRSVSSNYLQKANAIKYNG
ncbi:capsule biosynthesis protein [Glaesserella sp.]|uniref:capsule biosynthesis protein n=1 Tax=Glaesserella sp. TaxID=2094731 RepID=UPI0035A0108E